MNTNPIIKTTVFIAFISVFSGCALLKDRPRTPSVDSYMSPEIIDPANLINNNMGNDTKTGNSTSVPSKTTTKKMGLDECIAVALEKNPAVKSVKASMDIADEATGLAKSPYYPEIYASAGYSRFQKHAFMPGGLPASASSSVIGPENDWTGSINARITLFDSGERSARLDSAMARKDALYNESEKIRQEIITGVNRAFYSLMAARQTKEVAEKNLARAESHLEMAKKRFYAGAVSKTDVLRAQVGVADAKLGLVRTESMVSMFSGNLNAIMGIPVETYTDISGSLDDIRQPEKKDLENAFVEAREKRPELKAAIQKISAAQYGIEEAKAGFGPKLKAQANYGWEDDEWTPSDKTWLAGLTVEMPIFTGFAKTYNLAGKRAELRKEEAETIRLVQNVRQEVWNSYTRLNESYQAYLASRSMQKEAEESHRSTRERYEAGASTITDLLDAQVSLAKSEAGVVTSKWDYFISEAEFKKASGGI